MNRAALVTLFSSPSRFCTTGMLWAFVATGVASAQFADWTTFGFDAQRSNWLRTDSKISVEAMKKPGFELVWKNGVNTGGQQHRLSSPVLLDFYISYRGFRSLAFVGGSGNSVIAYDTDLGRVEWRKDFKVDSVDTSSASAQCPGGMTAGLSRPAIIGYPPPTGGGGAGRGTPAKSAVGEPFEGAVTIRRDPAPPRLPRQLPPSAAAAGRVAIPESPYAPRVQLVHALTSDGKLHSLYVSNGEEPKPAVQFIPANANARGLLILDNVAYVATQNGCGGVENGIWALDLKTQKVAHWKSDASIAGSGGLAAGADGAIYAAAGRELVWLQGHTLERKGSYSIGNDQFTSSPLVFDFNGKDLIAVASKDGKLHVIDPGSPSTALATPALSASELPGGALTSWSDAAGVRWFLAASSGQPANNSTNGAIVAWKLVDRGGKPVLERGWTSGSIASPLAPIVVNGVSFTLATGENRSGGQSRSVPAILYALDSATGKELWNSGKAITTYVTTGGLAAGGSRVYIAAQDGTLYVFGFPIEH